MKWLFVILSALTAVAANAQTVGSKSLEQQRKALLTEIESNKQLISDNDKSIRSGLNQLNLLDQQIQTRKRLLQVLEQEMQIIDRDINSKELQIKELEQQLQVSKQQYEQALQQLYKQRRYPEKLLFILSADNFSQSFRRILYLKKYSSWQYTSSEKIIAQQQQLHQEKQELIAAKADKERLSDVKRNEEVSLQKEEKRQQTQLNTLKSNKRKLQEEVEKKRKQAAALEREIARVLKEEIAKSEKAAKQNPSVARKAETPGGYAMTKEEQKLSSDFASNKGKLPFPLKGNYRIVRRFGERQYKNITDSANELKGIDIQTTSGNTAKAVFDGTVIVMRVPNSSLFVIAIRHGNYVSFYSLLNEVYVQKGEHVKTGQDLGKIYVDNGAAILHFEIIKGTKDYQNPELWLKK
ncbi:MAG: peptidoglycan DD-metalloendopeptidase family protein [Candidatus Symbiothrix sp.]|jgi:septal ring factor EnvC (AmiA/AmiB activator)|nr:peptidoglycan DD-metalloendopeptidase family protein [Candidatus Symbiothrix sp.]